MIPIFRKILFIHIILIVLLGGVFEVEPVQAFDDIHAAFSAAPTSGIVPLSVQFSDESTGGATGWTWYFGDEDFSEPWIQATSGAGWTGRTGASSVVLPDGTIVLMGGSGSGTIRYNDVWRSIDGGFNWTQVTAGAAWSARSYHNSVVTPDGSIVLMGGIPGISYASDVWRSTDGGETWTQMTASAPWGPRAAHSSDVLPDGSILLMGGYNGVGNLFSDVWRSTDGGSTWVEVTASAGWSARAYHNSAVLSDGSVVLMGGVDDPWGLGIKNDVWRSTDGGENWKQMTANAAWDPRTNHECIAVPDGSIVLMGGNAFSSYRNDVWRSVDNGTTWTAMTGSVGWEARFGHTVVMTQDGVIVLMGGAGSSSQKNDVWRLETAGSTLQFPEHQYTEIGLYSVTLQAYHSADLNTTRKTGVIHVQAVPVQADFSAAPTSGTASLAVQFSDESTGVPTGWSWYFGNEDFSADWTPVNDNAAWQARYDHSSVVTPSGTILLMGGTHTIWGFLNDVWRSSDGGVTWTQVTASASWGPRGGHSSVALPDGSILMMGGYDAGGYANDVWRSINNGATWTQVTASAEWSVRSCHSSVVLPDGSIVLMGGNNGSVPNSEIWRSTDAGATWTLLTGTPGWSARSRHTSAVLPDGSILLMGGNDGGIYLNDVWRSTDGGETWSEMTSSAGWSGRAYFTSAALPDGSIVVMGGYDGGNFKNDAWRSTDGGQNWTALTGGVGWSDRYGHTSLVLADGSILLMGGIDSSYERMNDIWRLETAGSILQNPEHHYTKSGFYSVTLQAYHKDAFGRTTKIAHIHVQPVPAQADFSASPTSGIGTLLVNFTNQSSGDFDACAWDFGDGNTSTECSDLSHTYAEPGTYTVSLTVSGAGGEDDEEKQDYIRVYVPAQAGFTGSPVNGIGSLLVNFTNQSSGDFDTCAWDFGDGNTSTECNNPSHTYIAPGIYTVSLTVGGAGGEDDEEKQDYIRVYTPVQADFSASPTSDLIIRTYNFTNQSSGDFDTCAWDFGDGKTSTECDDPIHTYDTPGAYTISLRVSGAGGEDIRTRTDYITVLHYIIFALIFR